MNAGRIEIIAGCIAVRYPGPGQSDDGPEYQSFCTTHRWASRPVPDDAVPNTRCPFCRVQIEEVIGRDRYRWLEKDMLAQEHGPFRSGEVAVNKAHDEDGRTMCLTTDGEWRICESGLTRKGTRLVCDGCGRTRATVVGS